MDEQNLFERVNEIDIEKEVKKSFLEYSMSVIVSRALPDIRDGLKPVHRRILYALYDQGMTHDKPHKKSANIVGEVMGKYHPHGDQAIYQTMVKMAQKFSLRYPLIDGHGNFGSIDGDAAAAMRYTESRMSQMASEMLKDIDKETIDWRPNYDDTREGPQVLPARVPNLLINGSAGIAVGMATNIPPHNLNEVADAITILIDQPDISIEELIQHIPGPDFPTAGMIMGTQGIKQAYLKGRGGIRIRARHHIEELKAGRQAIIITEMPYQVNKARVVEKIAELVRDKKIEGISDLRDESDRKGIRMVIELKKDANPAVIVNKLFKHTQLEDSFGIIMLGLVKGQPRVLNLKQIMEYFIEHRQEVIVRRTQYELQLAENRRHIVEGLKIALDHLDEVIQLIRNSKDLSTARQGLIKEFNLTEIQSNAILDMRLARLTALERERLEEEYRELLARIADLKDILARPERIRVMIKEDLSEVKEKYGNPRRTQIMEEEVDFNIEDLIDDHEVVIMLSNRGYIKRQPLDTYKSQRRGGRGVSFVPGRAEDFASNILVTSVMANILFFTNQGRVFSSKAYNIPETSRQAKGMPLINFLDLRPEEQITTLVAAQVFDDRRHLIMVTRAGAIKKVVLSAFDHVRKPGIIAINLKEGDELVGVVRVDGDDQVMIVTAQGSSIRFDEKQVRSMGRTAAGVRAIRLKQDDYVIGMDKCRHQAEVLLVTANGYGKRTLLKEFRPQNRGGRGVKAISITERNGPLVGFKIALPEEELVIITSEGHIIRMQIEDISRQKRQSRGVRVMRITDEDRVVGLARFKIEKEV